VRRVATLSEVQAADAAAAARVGEEILIARAAAAVATRAVAMLERAVYGRRVTVLAGSGHNGADAVWAASRLARRGAAVTLVRASEREPDEHGRAAIAALLAATGREAAEPPADTDLVIDGMTGVGATGPLRARAADLAVAVRGTRTLAVDLPSGVDTDSGAVTGEAVRADVTVTFDVLKPGLVVGAGPEYAGFVEVADVGLGLAGTSGAMGLLDADDVAALLGEPEAGSDKYSRGVVGLVTGSSRYPGAAVLSVGGAVRAGAGYVRYAGPAAPAVQQRWPTAVVGDGRVDAVVVGCGLGTDAGTLERTRQVLRSELPAVVDADGLSVGRAALSSRTAPTLITPHANEFERLTGVDPSANPLGAALRAARELGVTVLLKGVHTVVAAPDGRARINSTGTTWLSTAGTGDVLAGAAGALMAALVKRGMAAEDVALEAGSAAAFLHGLAGQLAASGAASGRPAAFPADALFETWSEAVRAVRSKA
jgi:hydroxyethylthiazole kinase-like uncharacterized protein yjeF